MSAGESSAVLLAPSDAGTEISDPASAEISSSNSTVSEHEESVNEFKNPEDIPVKSDLRNKAALRVHLEPELEEKFRPADVQRLVEKTVEEYLEGLVYDREKMPNLVKVLADAIQTKVIKLNYKRYKIVTYITIGERLGEGATSVTRCLWDPMSDCMATYSFINDTLFCGITVYGIYLY